MIEISVIMSVYNGELSVRNAIYSILNQSFDNFEFIIINDGSTDGTSIILKEFSDYRLKIINQDNIGLTKSLNKALKIAKGTYIARQDADDYSFPDRLAKQYLQFKNDTSLVLLGTRTIIKNNILNSESITSTFHSDNIRTELKIKNIFIHSSVMFKASEFKVLGFYNEKYEVSQDYDAWLRFSDNINNKLMILDEILVLRNVDKNCVSVLKNYRQSINGFKIRKGRVNLLKNIFLSLIQYLLNILPVRLINIIKIIKTKFIYLLNY